jgi:predicted RNA-binding Zn-ribbon protein involved in translation (DUF1610 family)
MISKVARPRLPSIACPHCATRVIVRSSEQVTETYRELRVRCDNDDCGWAGCADLTITRTTAQSARPNANIHIPTLRPRAAPRPANDDMPVAANDAAPSGTASCATARPGVSDDPALPSGQGA